MNVVYKLISVCLQSCHKAVCTPFPRSRQTQPCWACPCTQPSDQTSSHCHWLWLWRWEGYWQERERVETNTTLNVVRQTFCYIQTDARSDVVIDRLHVRPVDSEQMTNWLIRTHIRIREQWGMDVETEERDGRMNDWRIDDCIHDGRRGMDGECDPPPVTGSLVGLIQLLPLSSQRGPAHAYMYVNLQYS